MHVEIKSKTSINHRQGNNGKTYGEQQAALFEDGADFPIPFKLNVEVGHEKDPGRYRIGRGSHGTDKFGNLVLTRLNLELEAEAGKKAA